MSAEKVLVMVELKWKAAPLAREILVGEIETVMLPGGGVKIALVSVTQDVAVALGSTVDATVIWMGLIGGMLVGAR